MAMYFGTTATKKIGRWERREIKEFFVQQIDVTQSPPLFLSLSRPFRCLLHTQICLLKCPIKDTEIRARKWMPLKMLFTHFRHRVPFENRLHLTIGRAMCWQSTQFMAKQHGLQTIRNESPSTVLWMEIDLASRAKLEQRKNKTEKKQCLNWDKTVLNASELWIPKTDNALSNSKR